MPTSTLNESLSSLQTPSKEPTSSTPVPTSTLENLASATDLPNLDSQPLPRRLLSHSLLLGMIIGMVGLGWIFGLDLLQFSNGSYTELLLPLGGVVLGVLGLLAWTGSLSLDFWDLVMKWGWYSIPAVGAAGLLFVVMQERTEMMGDVE